MSKNINKISEEDLEKYAKKMRKKMSRNTPAKVLLRVITGALGVYLGFTARTIVVSNTKYLNTIDNIPKVADAVGVDMQMMQLGFSVPRLKPNKSGNVYVYIDENIPENTRANITSSLEYYNEILSKITNKYNFKVCNVAEYLANKAISNSTIKFEYKTLDGLDHGHNFTDYNKTILNSITDSEEKANDVYIVNSTIYLNQKYFEKISDDAQTCVIRHELLHTLGFNDTYVGYKEETSLMNTAVVAISNNISPNDLKRLFVAYDENLASDGKINQRELNRVSQIIQDYENKYYETLMQNVFSKIPNNFSEISESEVANFNDTVNNIEVNIDKYNNFTYKTSGVNRGGGRIILGKNYVILPNVIVDNYNDFLVLLKDENGLKAYNLSFFHETNDYTTLDFLDKYSVEPTR